MCAKVSKVKNAGERAYSVLVHGRNVTIYSHTERSHIAEGFQHMLNSFFFVISIDQSVQRQNLGLKKQLAILSYCCDTHDQYSHRDYVSLYCWEILIFIGKMVGIEHCKTPMMS